MLTAPRPSPAARRPVPDSAGAPAARRRRSSRARADGAATCALALVTLASSSGLLRVFAGHGWVTPVVVTVVGTHAWLWALRRWQVSEIPAALLGVAGMALLVVWAVFGSSTSYGIPVAGTWHQIAAAIRSIRPEVASSVAPVAATPSFEMLAAAGAGVTAFLADSAAFRWRSPLVALMPGLAAFVGSATAGRGPGRGPVIAAEVTTVVAFLLVERAAASKSSVWFAGASAGVLRWFTALGAAGVVLAVLSALVVTPGLRPEDGVGALGWKSKPGSASGSERIVPNPIVSLQTRLLKQGDRPVFTVDSTYPSYWRLTSLDHFNGVTWTATGSYRGFSTRLPGVVPSGPGVQEIHATFRIQALDSAWLPEQFNPVAVSGVSRVSYDARSNSLLTSKPTSNGLRYSVVSYEYLDTLSAAALEAAPPVPPRSVPPVDLRLPRSVPADVLRLAREITARSHTEYDKAIAIQDFLLSPPFTYSLDPPSDGSSSQALENFLFSTHEGYCQQFAGAYAVLARAAGLPTRLAIGFSTGTALPGGGYQVYDRDAHTWPEVYFGPQYGWLPFEPTPGFTVPGTGGYSAAVPAAGGVGSTPAATTLPSASRNPASSLQRRGPTATTLAPKKPSTVVSSEPSAAAGGSWWLLALPVAAGAVLAWCVLNVAVRRLLRRARRARASRAGARLAVLEAWEGVVRDLSRSGIKRLPGETHDELATRAVHALRCRGAPGTGDETDLPALAEMARRAAFAPSVPPGDGPAAQTLADAVSTRLWHRMAWRKRLITCLRPTGGTARTAVASLRPQRTSDHEEVLQGRP